MAANTIALYAVAESNASINTSFGLYGNGQSDANGLIPTRSTSIGLYGTLQTQFPTNAEQLLALLSNQDNVKFYLTSDGRQVYSHTDLNPPLYGAGGPEANTGVGDQFYIDTTTLNLWWKHPDTLVWLLISGSGSGAGVPLVHFPVTTNGNNQTFSSDFLLYYTNAQSLTAMRNGILIEATDYTLSNSNITFNVQLFANDNIDIIPTSNGGGGGGGSNYSNANVQAFLPNYNGAIGNITTTANITAGNVRTDNLLHANGTAWSFFDANALANYLPNYNANIAANNFNGGNFSGNVGTFNTVIAGNITYSNATTLNIANKVINLAVGSPNAMVSDGGGIVLTNAAQLLYNYSTNEWQSNVSVRSSANIVGANVVTDNLLHVNGTPWTFFDANALANYLPNYLSNYNGNVGNGNGAFFANALYTNNLLYANGSPWTLASQYGNANVISLLASGSVGNVIVQAGGNLVSDTLKFSNGANALYSNTNAGNFIANYTGNLNLVGANISLGNVSNLHITGGVGGQVLSTDGIGGLSWVNQTGGGNANGNVMSTGTLTFAVTANGNNQTFTNNIIANFTNAYNLNVVKDGVVLEPAIDYTKSGNSITINRPLVVGSTIDVLSTGQSTGNGGGTPAGNNNQIQFNLSNAFAASGNLLFADDANGGTLTTNNIKSSANTPLILTTTNNNTGTAPDIVLNAGEATGGIGKGGSITLQAGGGPNAGDIFIGTIDTANISIGGANVKVAISGNIRLGDVANLHITGGNANQYLQTDGNGNLSWSNVTSGSNTTPGGSNTQIQYNANGAFGGANGFVYRSASNTVALTTGNTPEFGVLLNSNGLFVGSGTPLSESNAGFVIASNGVASFTGSNVSLGSVANLHITGGNNGQFLTTNGSGGLSWANVGGGSGSNIANGNSNVTVTANSNITFGVSGTSNVINVGNTITTIRGTLDLATDNANGIIGIGSSTSQSATGTNVIGIGAGAAGVKSNVAGLIAIGTNAGQRANGSYVIAIGDSSGIDVNGTNAISNSVAIGFQTVQNSKGSNIIGIGARSSINSNGNSIIGVGFDASNNATGTDIIGIGNNASYNANGTNIIGIGNNSIKFNFGSTQANYMIAIGANAATVSGSSINNVIVLNANSSGPTLGQSNSFYVNPIRSTTIPSGNNILYYNPSTYEVTYANTLSISSLTRTANANVVTVGNVITVVINGTTYNLLAR